MRPERRGGGWRRCSGLCLALCSKGPGDSPDACLCAVRCRAHQPVPFPLYASSPRSATVPSVSPCPHTLPQALAIEYMDHTPHGIVLPPPPLPARATPIVRATEAVVSATFGTHVSPATPVWHHCLCSVFFCRAPARQMVVTFPPLCPSPPRVHPPPQGGNRRLAHEQLEINRKSQAPKAPKKIFGWVILELAGREWGTPPPPPGGELSSLGGGWTWGGEGRIILACVLRAGGDPGNQSNADIAP